MLYTYPWICFNLIKPNLRIFLKIPKYQFQAKDKRIPCKRAIRRSKWAG